MTKIIGMDLKQQRQVSEFRPHDYTLTADAEPTCLESLTAEIKPHETCVAIITAKRAYANRYAANFKRVLLSKCKKRELT